MRHPASLFRKLAFSFLQLVKPLWAEAPEWAFPRCTTQIKQESGGKAGVRQRSGLPSLKSHMSAELVQSSVSKLQNLAKWEATNHNLSHVGRALTKTELRRHHCDFFLIF